MMDNSGKDEDAGGKIHRTGSTAGLLLQRESMIEREALLATDIEFRFHAEHTPSFVAKPSLAATSRG